MSESPKSDHLPPVEHEASKQLHVDLEKAFGVEKQWTVDLATFPDHLSHDLVPVLSPHKEPNAAQYDRFSSRRKIVITAVLSYVCILPPSSSTSILPAIPEVAAEYGSTGSIIGISNALYMLFMGLSPLFCGSLTQIYGRWPVIVTYKSWRVIFWLQSALAGAATLLIFFLLPETIPHKRSSELQDDAPREKLMKIWGWVNPARPFLLLFRYPNILIVAIASASLVFNMYSLLTPIRYVLNPRFHLDSPMQSGLFYVAPGCGYLLGCLLGGRWADRVVKKWIRKSGTRVPEDRLRSCLASLGIVLPVSMLVYGWSVDRAVGGVPVPVLAMFVQGVAQLFSFPSLNTYCIDVMQSKGRSAEVVASNYMVRYLFTAVGSAVALPAVQGIGVGWFSTISAGFLSCSALLVWATVIWGKDWRAKVDEKKDQRKSERKTCPRLGAQ
ncbi:MAG: hypothetical protein Q9160_005928 [Pyrenula sp. 1 TL-2023]